MRPLSTDVRCKSCSALLAKRDPSALTIRRGSMEVTLSGSDFELAVTCYRCRAVSRLSAALRATSLVA